MLMENIFFFFELACDSLRHVVREEKLQFPGQMGRRCTQTEQNWLLSKKHWRADRCARLYVVALCVSGSFTGFVGYENC